MSGYFVGKGSATWGGFCGTCFFVDPSNRRCFMIFSHVAPWFYFKNMRTGIYGQILRGLYRDKFDHAVEDLDTLNRVFA